MSSAVASKSNKGATRKSDTQTMPSRTTRDENDMTITPTKPRSSKTAKRAPADPPGLATDVGPFRSPPRRSQSENTGEKKKKTTKTNDNRIKTVSRTKSSSEQDADDSASLQPPPIPVRRQTSGTIATGKKAPLKTGNKSSTATKKTVQRTKSASEASPHSQKKKAVGRTKSAEGLALATPPLSPARRSQSVYENVPKSPASILKPASYKVKTTTKPKSFTSLDTKPAAKPKETAKPKSSQSLLGNNPSSKSKKASPTLAKIPSSPRSQVANELAKQEAKILNSKSGRDAPVGSASKQARQAPGAYLVQGQNVALAPTGMLSSQHEPSPRNNKKRASDPSASKSGMMMAPLELAPPVVGGSIPAPTNSSLVVAAELSTDVESQIEAEVRQRLLQNTVRANVVSVVHGKTLYDPEVEAKRVADLKELHKPRGMKEKLFGDTRNSEVDIAANPECITKRTYLKWTVRRNPATNLWVSTVQTNQKAVETGDTIEIERNTLSFSATTQPEAFETGLANATPLLHPHEQHPICNVCKAKFALFRRPVHCRNCGVCVCSSCATTWPSKMLPESFNTKNSSVSQVCLACDFLANSFRDALVEGDYRSVQHLYATGNVNLRAPFCLDRKAEAMYPVHLAILGGNVKIVKWLCSERFCPLRMPKRRGKKDGPILTSKGRSPLGIALLHQKLDIVRYLVADMGVSLFEEKDMNTNMALANFTSLLKMLPESTFEGKKMVTTAVPNSAVSSPGMRQHTSLGPSLSSDSLYPSTAAARRPSL